MDPHPDFADTELPREAVLPEFRLTRLDPTVLDEDYAAVMASQAVLAGFWGDWPSGLTRADNALDLAWHDREFTLKRSFSWVVRDPEGQYLGCLYLFPDPGQRGTAEAVCWVCDLPDRSGLMAKLRASLPAWIESHLPESVRVRWRTSP